jgi:O-acetyl-ADP-ribose deacetylase (regulator of RNase III)
VDEAAQIAVDTVHRSLSDFPELHEVIFCCFSERDLQLYQRLLS